MLPIQITLNFLYVEEVQDKEQTKNYNELLAENKLDYIIQLKNVENFHLIVNVFDMLLVFKFVFCMLLFLCFKADFSQTRVKTSYSFIIISFSVTLFGTLLFPYLLTFQVLSIRCYFTTNLCLTQPHLLNTIISCIGSLLNLSFFYFSLKLLTMPFPHPKIPWAAPPFRLHYIQKLVLILLACQMSFQDFLLDQVDIYIILIPFLFAQVVQTWLQVTTRTAFQSIVENSMIFRDITTTIMVFIALCITVFNDQGDAGYFAILVVTCAIASVAIYLMKAHLFYEEILVDSPKSEIQAHQIITTIVKFQLQTEPRFDKQLSLLYNRHIWKCKEPECPCQNLIVDDEEERLRQTLLHEQEDDNPNGGHFRQSKQHKLLDRRERNKAILLFTFRKFLRTLNSKVFRFLEIFINVYFYSNRLHLSFFNLEKMKSTVQNQQEKQLYSYLKLITIWKIKKYERESKEEVFDIEKAIKIESKLQQYSKLIEETSILVERFWYKLAKNGYQLTELQGIGSSIVANYLEAKDKFEELIELNQENKEVVTLSINFHQNVMNFEQEAHQGYNQLKNIQQKIKILRQNQYGISKESLGQIISTLSGSGRVSIIYCNKNICEFLGYGNLDLLGKDINILIPRAMIHAHNKTIQEFFEKEHSRFINNGIPRVWMKRKDETIITASFTVQTCISYKKGLTLVTLLNPFEEIPINSISYKHDEVSVLLLNDQNVITDISFNFKQNFLENKHVYMKEQKYFVEDLFPGYSNFTDDELAQGQCLTINPKFFLSMSQVLIETEDKLQKVLVFQNVKKFKNWPIVKEIIVINKKRDGLHTIRLNNEDIMQLEEAGPDDEETVTQQFQGYSSESSISNSSSIVQVQKGIIDLKQIPQSLQSLRNVIILFFIILICTCMALLGVSVYSSNQFNKDQNLVDQFTLLASNLASLRLVFRQLVFQGQDPHPHQEMFVYLQEQIEKNSARIRDNDDYIKNNEAKFDAELRELINGNNLMIFEANGKDEAVTNRTTTYQIGLNQFLTKFQNFTKMEEDDMHEEFAGTTILEVFPGMSKTRQETYFITQNGNKDLRDLTKVIMDQLVEQSIGKGRDWESVVLIISLCCIFVTVLTSSILIPFIFTLENESRNVMLKWICISPECKEGILKRINTFSNELHNERKGGATQEEVLQYESDQEPDQQHSEEFKNDNDLRRSRPVSIEEGHYDEQFRSISQNSHKVHREPSDFSGANSNESKSKKHGGTLQHQKVPQPLHPEPRPPGQVSDITEEASNDDFDNVNNYSTALKHIDSLFFGKKLKNILMILSMSCLIVTFYIGTYFLAISIFNSIAASFRQIAVSNMQNLCLSESFAFFQESVAHNQSILIDYNTQEALDYIQNDCFDNELKFESYFQNTPKELESVIDTLQELRSTDACTIVFDDAEKIKNCSEALNGILTEGLKTANKYVLHYILKKFVDFESIPDAERTNQLIQDYSFLDDTLEDYVSFILRYLNEALEYKNTLVLQSINSYLGSRVNLIIIVFSVFAVILIISLVFTLSFVLDMLKRRAFENRVLIKMIPFDEIMEIQAKENERKQRKLDRKEFYKEKQKEES